MDFNLILLVMGCTFSGILLISFIAFVIWCYFKDNKCNLCRSGRCFTII